MTRTIVSFTCAYCGGDAQREIAHINRARKLGLNLYCSKKCFGLGRRRRTPEDIAEYQRKYREAHRDKSRQYRRDLRTGESRERILEAQRASYERNREECLRRSKEYARKNREQVRARTRQWLKDNPDKADIHGVKANLSVSIGVRVADLPMDLVEAKVAQVRIARWVRAEISKQKKQGKEGS